MKVFVTKYALTQGIIEREADYCSYLSIGIIKARGPYTFEYYHKPFWYETMEEAIAHAETIRDKKLKSIEKQMKRIKSIKF